MLTRPEVERAEELPRAPDLAESDEEALRPEESRSLLEEPRDAEPSREAPRAEPPRSEPLDDEPPALLEPERGAPARADLPLGVPEARRGEELDLSGKRLLLTGEKTS